MKKIFFILMLLTLLTVPAAYAEQAETQANTEKGLVVFFRDSAFAGKAIRFNLNQGNEPIGALKSGTVLRRDVEPGTHTFWSQAISKDSIAIDVEAGKTYYIRGVVMMGLVAGRPTLSVATEEEALAAIKQIEAK
jgi:hypothetical protein